ncbi:PH domain-containing protein [Methyloferula stellata]|uniref:PH domain-containing protein n=1 Tax=Methyloferula stellata TaxID=876270 RepID=UPI00037D7694|nr:PH domain-containing protein [Methyloferula stellata]
MSYVNQILQPGEKVLVVGRIHWIIYMPGILWLICAAAAFGLSVHFKYTHYQWPALALAFVFLILGLAGVLRAWWKSFTTEIAVTTTRVVHKRGFINRYTNEMNMDKVESVIVDQSILGRLLDYGTIAILGTGQGFEKLKFISHAIELRNAITSR